MNMHKPLVRASYESCLTATARLNAFATSRPFLEASEVNSRQDILAMDDLILFCIHARRLIESVGLKDLVLKTSITTNSAPISLWKIIGGLIHNDELMIIRSESRWKMFHAMLESQNDNKYWERVAPHIKNVLMQPR